MARIYIIRHASPAIQPTTPAVDWPLSERGVGEAQRLATIAAAWHLQALYASVEHKAQSTALIVGDACGLPVRSVEGLEELRFDAWIQNSDEFSEAVREILARPERSIRGAERADVAAQRFARAIDLVRDGPSPAAVVSHGRVITAWLAASGAVEDAFAIWRGIPMPGWCEVDVEAERVRLISPFEGLPRERT
jgi:broad specificity phosphatase PhoE